MRRRIGAFLLSGILTVSMFTGCGSQSSTNNLSNTTSSEGSSEEKTTKNTETEKTTQEEEHFTIKYPSYMTDSEGDALELEKEPEKIVCLSNAALQILVRCDIKPIAITSTASGIDYPDWVEELPTIETGMSEVDTESIIALEPDLVIMGEHLKEDYGKLLADANIPVYYSSEGPSTTYEEVKEAAVVFGEAFGGEEEKAAIEAEFKEVEDRAKEYAQNHDTKKMMILFSLSPAYQQTSEGYLGSMLSLLPFENLSDSLIDPSERTAPLDMEKLVEMNPEVLFAISPMAQTSEDVEKMFQAEFDANPQIWNNLDAVKNGTIIYLPNEYVKSKGMYIINSLNTLMDMLEETLQ